MGAAARSRKGTSLSYLSPFLSIALYLARSCETWKSDSRQLWPCGPAALALGRLQYSDDGFIASRIDAADQKTDLRLRSANLRERTSSAHSLCDDTFWPETLPRGGAGLRDDAVDLSPSQQGQGGHVEPQQQEHNAGQDP
jgi:hypothetical protein